MTGRSRSLRAAVGSLLIAGLEGPELTSTEKAWLKLIRPSGVILFRRNIATAEQTHSLLRTAQEAGGAPLFRCIDVEGGSVDRLRDLVAPAPSASDVAGTQRRSMFEKHGVLIGRELALLGLNVTFAPVLDVQTDASRAVLGSRTASSLPHAVADYAERFLTGLAREGIVGCGKHFPGLGRGNLDSHQATPVIESTVEQMWTTDLLPYRILASHLAFIMVAHAAYPRTRSGAQPASISKFWIEQVLKGKIGYRGLVLSDDMEMGGILSQASIEEASVQAVLAGTHLLEICRDPALVLSAYEGLLAEAERSRAFAARVDEACRFVQRAKQRHLGHGAFPRMPTAQKLAKVRTYVERFAEQVRAAAAKQVQ